MLVKGKYTICIFLILKYLSIFKADPWAASTRGCVCPYELHRYLSYLTSIDMKLGRDYTLGNPYKCSFCGKGFTCNSELTMHQKHTL